MLPVPQQFSKVDDVDIYALIVLPAFDHSCRVNSVSLNTIPNGHRRDWRFHYPNTLPQRMTSLSLLACSYAFTAEMYLDFAESFQAWLTDRHAHRLRDVRVKKLA